MFEIENPIILVLDVDSADHCLALAESLKGHVGAYKVGPRLVVRYGAGLISRLAESAPVFVDNKYLDIPSTMEAAIRATFEAGASLATVHAWAGPEALRRMAEVEAELNKKRPFKILVVTILTSFSQETLPAPLRTQPVASQVDQLADLALECGLSGLVCFPQEVSSLRAKSSTAFLVTPGVRLPSDDKGDQKRVGTPEEAIRNGASALVVGRPIYEASNPQAAAQAILRSALAGRA